MLEYHYPKTLCVPAIFSISVHMRKCFIACSSVMKVSHSETIQLFVNMCGDLVYIGLALYTISIPVSRATFPCIPPHYLK